MARSKKINVAKAQKDLKQSIVGTYLNLDKQFNGVDPCTGTVQQRVTALHKLASDGYSSAPVVLQTLLVWLLTCPVVVYLGIQDFIVHPILPADHVGHRKHV